MSSDRHTLRTRCHGNDVGVTARVKTVKVASQKTRMSGVALLTRVLLRRKYRLFIQRIVGVNDRR